MASDLKTGLFKKKEKGWINFKSAKQNSKRNRTSKSVINQTNISILMPVLPVQDRTIRAEALWLVSL